MAFIGNTNITQAFTPAIDFFSGNASTTAFTLSRPVASVAQVEVYVSNVPQTPGTAYTVSSNTITFTSAPPSGTNNIYVYYTSPITQVIAPGQGTVTSSSFGTITDFTTTGNTTLGDATTDTLTVGVTGIVKDASGNVGIGASSPIAQSQLTVASKSLSVTGSDGNFSSGGVRAMVDLAGGTQMRVGPLDGGTATATTLAFLTSPGSAGGNERMRIDSSGNVAVGATSGFGGNRLYASGVASATNSSGVLGVQSSTTGDTAYPVAFFCKFDNNSSTSQVYLRFAMNNNGSSSGQINGNGVNAAAFGSWSDRRLKENITELPSQLANIMALRPVEYDYIESEGGGHQIGFIAQEVQGIYPDLVGERDDGMLTLSDMNKNDARLIKCIQEQQALITALTARITALENK